MTPSEILNRAADLIRDTAALAVAPPWAQSLRSVMHGPDEEHEVALTPTTRTAAWIALMSPAVAPHLEAWLRMAAEEYARREYLPKLGDPNPNNLPVDLTGAFGPSYWSLALDMARAVLGVPEEDEGGTDPGWDPRVRACQPPELAVMVNGFKVPIQPPDMLGILSRVDLVVAETRPDRDGVQFRALMGVPSHQPFPPAQMNNVSVWQAALAYVSVKRHQAVIQEADITAITEDVRPVDLGEDQP